MKEMRQRERRLQRAAEVCLPERGFSTGIICQDSAPRLAWHSSPPPLPVPRLPRPITRHTVPSRIIRNSLKTNKSAHGYPTQKRGVYRSGKSLGERQICFGVERRIG